MRVLIGTILATALMAGTAAAAVFGPPEPLADAGKASVDAGYAFDRTRLKQDGDRLGTRSNQFYLQGDYTFIRDWGVYGRVGGSDMVVRDRDTHQRFGDGAAVFGSLGLKGLAYRGGKFGVGPFVEGSLYGDRSGMMKNQWEANVGVAGQYKIQNVTVYGGPFAYWRRADSELPLAPPISRTDIKERHNVGGFVGVTVPVVAQKVFLTAEGQMKDTPGAGATISYRF
jgi:hypothetical protein